MPVPEGYRRLPQSNSMLDAFFIPSQNHSTIGKTVEDVRKADFEKVAKATADFFFSGLAFLANRGHDNHIQEVGAVSWGAIVQSQVNLVGTNNMGKALKDLGVSSDKVSEMSSGNDVMVLYRARRYGISNMLQGTYVIIPPEFASKAQTHPLEALATVAWIGSQLRDRANRRFSLDIEYVLPRADATKAHFLHEAVRRHPKVLLSKDSQDLRALYPDGIYSPRLPKKALYKGISGTELIFASRN